MIDDHALAKMLSDFARILATDFQIQAVLDHLVERIADVLPVTSVGVTLISSGSRPRHIAASDGDALAFEQLQTETNQGPCAISCQTGQAVSVVDLRTGDVRFPEFCAAAATAGLGAVFTFPLHNGPTGARLGAI